MTWSSIAFVTECVLSCVMKSNSQKNLAAVRRASATPNIESAVGKCFIGWNKQLQCECHILDPQEY